MVKQVKTFATPDLNQNLTPALLGQAVRARRTQSYLRLEDAAALCGVAKQTLQDIEHAPFYDLVNVKMYPDFEQEMAMALLRTRQSDQAAN